MMVSSSKSAARQSASNPGEPGRSNRPLAITPDRDLDAELDRKKSSEQQVAAHTICIELEFIALFNICVQMVCNMIWSILCNCSLAGGTVKAGFASGIKATAEDDSDRRTP